MRNLTYFWNITARYSINPNTFRVTIPLFDRKSPPHDYRFTVSINPVGNELVIDAIKNMDVQYKNGESGTSSPRKYESNGRTEFS
jgi:hypothetical protein